MWWDDLPRTIDADEAPGGFVMVVYVDDVEMLVQKIPLRMIEKRTVDAASQYAKERSHAWRAEGHDVAMQVFDGDSGKRKLSARLGSQERVWHA